MTELERGNNLRVFFDELNKHAKECTSFDGYKYSTTYIGSGYERIDCGSTGLPQDSYWEIAVDCECGRKHSLLGEGGYIKSLKSVEEYCEASNMFSKSTRDEAIASQVHGEDVLCPILVLATLSPSETIIVSPSCVFILPPILS